MKFIRSIYKKLRRKFTRFINKKWISELISDIKKYNYQPGLAKKADWPMFFVTILIAIAGVMSIFSATSSASSVADNGLIELLRNNSTRYAGTQLMWVGVGIFVMCAVSYLDYHIYAKYSHLLYYIQIFMLLFILAGTAGRGGMTAFMNIGQYGVQPSEFGKVVMVIALADLFARRSAPIKNLYEVLPSLVFVGIPAVLVLFQPDVGTMLVYFVIYVMLLWLSGTKGKLIWGVIVVVILLAIPAWFYFNTASDDFRLTRILMWLHPSRYPDDARQVINGQIAIGTGGLFGNGITSVGSFASLGYIPDDHTDFCFSIFCEAFGFVGAIGLLACYAFLMFRMFRLAQKTTDLFGRYLLAGVGAIFFFHVFENIGMIIGVFPVTGIPLPLISYGGSNCLTNFAAIGLVMNVVMRSKEKQLSGHNHYTKRL